MTDSAAQDAAPVLPLSRTLAIVKPDAVAAGKAEEILHLAELAGFTVIQQQHLQLTVARAEAFYAEHKERPFFPGLVKFMTSGPIVAAVLARPGAVAAWRALIGPTNSLDARAKAPKSLRALYGTDGTRNALHGSDSATSAAREARFFFPRLQAPPGSGADAEAEAEAAKAYVAERLQPTLAEALTFMARWMLDNNPNKPRLTLPEGAAAAAAEAAANARQQQAAMVMRAAAAGLPQMIGAVRSADGTSGALGPGQFTGAEGQDEAAVKVQAAFRGHQARLQTAEMRAGAGEQQ